MDKRRSFIIQFTIYLSILIVLFFLFTRFFTTITLNNNQMNPAIMENETVLVRKLVFNTDIKRNDVVVYEINTNEGIMYSVKRVVGLPGETIVLGENDTIYINDELYEDPYMLKDDDSSYQSGLTYTLGEDEYFCLGDNRHHSIDSRSIGAIKKDKIYGVLLIKIKPLSFNKI